MSTSLSASIQPQFQLIDGLNIRYADTGGPHDTTLLLTSPWPESLYAYTPMWTTLAGHARLFAVDLPGFGASERRDDLLSPRAMGGFLATLVAEAGLGRPHIVAPDIGTSAALFGAATQPQLFASVTVGTGGTAVPLQLGEPLRSWVLDPDLDKYRRIDPHVIVNTSLDKVAGGVADDVRADYLACYEGDRFVESMRYVRRYPEELPALAELLPQITTPVTIINGRYDSVVPLANAEFLDERLPNSRLRIIDAGHSSGKSTPRSTPRPFSSRSQAVTHDSDRTYQPQHGTDTGRRGGRHRLPLSPLRQAGAGTAGHAAALPRQPGQLGPDSDRRARRRARDHPRRLSGRRLLDRPGEQHDRRDRAADDRVHHSAQPSADRPARLLDRRVRRPGDRAGATNSAATAGPGGDGPEGSTGHARVARRHRRRRSRRKQAREPPLHHVRPHRHEPAKGREYLGRFLERHERDIPTSDAARDAQYDAIVDWGVPDHGALQRLTGIQNATLVIQGDNDLMIPTRLSHLLAGLIPDAQIRIYPDAAHGFLFQYPAEAAAAINEFLAPDNDFDGPGAQTRR